MAALIEAAAALDAATLEARREEHQRDHCDCYWAHPMCWHCYFKPPFCDYIIYTGLLVIGKIFTRGAPHFVLFCTACYRNRATYYNLVPDADIDYREAYAVMGAKYQAERGVVIPTRDDLLSPMGIISVRTNDEDGDFGVIPLGDIEDEFTGFEYEEASQDALELDVSAITGERESDVESDPAE
jgi:hypothetical protein